jgi:hypothetical protein
MDDPRFFKSMPRPVGFRNVRTNMQIVAEVASVLTGQDRIPALIAECVVSRDMREDILRTLLGLREVPKDSAEGFIARYLAAKAEADAVLNANQASAK